MLRGRPTRGGKAGPVPHATGSRGSGAQGAIEMEVEAGEEGLMKAMPTFSAEDENTLQDLCRQIAPLV